MIKRLLLFIVLLSIAFFFTQGHPNYSAEEAINHVGENAFIEGEVAQVTVAENGNVFISIGNKYPKAKFVAIILSIEVKLFSKVEEMEGRRIRVYGMIENDKGSVQVILRSRAQIKILK
jgi:exonuclease VII large subunit